MVKPIVVKVDKRLFKKCIKCRSWKSRLGHEDEDEIIHAKGFGAHDTSSDGLQSICFACKNVANKVSRNKNPKARLRHHTATRCLTQLGELAPDQFVANLEDYLGYRISALVKHLSSDLKAREGSKRKLVDALNDGYHIDHIYPLSRWPVIIPSTSVGEMYEVDWDIFRQCWALDNLTAIPAEENLKKGAKLTKPTIVVDVRSTPSLPPDE